MPDQSMSIREIVRRFVRGIPVDVIQHEPVYSENDEHDLEKLSRMDFGAKAEFAEALGREAAQLESELNERVTTAREAQAKKAKEKAEAEAQAKEQAEALAAFRAARKA